MSRGNGHRPRRRVQDLAPKSGGTTLITGGAGFIGSNVADRLLREGARVRVVDDLSRPGVESNLAWLENRHRESLEVEVGDLRKRATARAAVSGVDAIVHLAAQVAVTTSLNDPADDFAVNLLGTVNLLEEARRMPSRPPILFTSTNKVYGCLEDVAVEAVDDRYEPIDRHLRDSGISELRPLRFSTPYGCSKGAADQYVLDYAASFGLPSLVFRMSCIYGPRQFGTEDQGWVAHFLIRALDGEPLTIYGDGKQVRDVLFVEDLLDAMLVALERAPSLAGRAFNIGGGREHAVSLLEVVELIEELTGAPPAIEFGSWRTGDQRWYVSDTGRFAALTGWRPRTAPRLGVLRLYEWLTGTAARRRARIAA
jgi:CDP-paratose 2-epimerase